MASKFKRIPEVVRYNEVKHLLCEAQKELASVQEELDKSDRRATKAFRLGVTLKSIYADENDLYTARVRKIHVAEDAITAYTKEIDEYEKMYGKPTEKGEV